jgi:hypothetical protein
MYLRVFFLINQTLQSPLQRKDMEKLMGLHFKISLDGPARFAAPTCH